MAGVEKIPQLSASRGRVKLAPWRLAGAFLFAAASDVLSVFVEFLPPVQIVVDLVTGLVLWGLLGWRWYLLPALVVEAIPGLAAFPMWVLVVGAYAVLPGKMPRQLMDQDNQETRA